MMFGLGNARTGLRRSAIEGATGLVEFWPALHGSPEHPEAKLGQIKHHLEFMGNGGSKWSAQQHQMEQMLARVGELGGQVRLLLLRPDCEACKEASRNRFPKEEDELPRRNTSSLMQLEKLRQRFPHLEIKLYEHAPFFRLTFTDIHTVSVGHYQKYWEDSTNTPLLVFKDGRDSNEWSFFVAFSRYFQEEWRDGDPLNSADLDRLAEEYGL
ncbi:MAG TPA: DUF5919 domain-containing protein [Solirubrobacterales bacterium]|jgi:hypothetical protein|nr:DUF5919 domain-containing protein [Solirubrobacterales bacterium]